MLEELLTKVERIEKKYDGKLQQPASDEEIQKFKVIVKEKLGTELPDQYLSFLKMVNGLDFNGMVIYGIDPPYSKQSPADSVYGFIETNEIWHKNEDQKHYIFFGDSDISWYCLNLSNGDYEIRDKPSGTLMEVFKDFNSMLISALQLRIK